MPRSRRRIPELGPRGEGWVVLQALAILGIVVCSILFLDLPAPGPVGIARAVTGVSAAGGGTALLALGVVGLGSALTPLPRPRAGATLRRAGVYGHVRHPIYGGLLLAGAGSSIAVAPLALLPTAALAVVFALKARREEAWLSAAHPEYDEYRSTTPRRFLPWV